MSYQYSVYRFVQVLNLLFYVVLFDKLINDHAFLLISECKFLEFLILVKQQHAKLFNVLVNVIVDRLGEESASCRRRVNVHSTVVNVNNIFEFVLPNGVVHGLKLLKIVFYYAFFIFPV